MKLYAFTEEQYYRIVEILAEQEEMNGEEITDMEPRILEVKDEE